MQGYRTQNGKHGRLVMISTNKLTTIYNLWGEREQLHPLECAEAMSYDARLNKKQKIWIHRFIKIWQYADLKEYELRDLFDFSERCSEDYSDYYYLIEDKQFCIEQSKWNDSNNRTMYLFKVIAREIDGDWHTNLLDAMREVIKLKKRLG